MTHARDPVDDAALRLFGVPYLYPIQRYLIANILEGRNQVGVLPTGAGKSMCFQLPSQLMAGVTVVLVPLLSLLSDQVAGLERRGVPAGVLRGGQGQVERRDLKQRLRAGQVRIVYATPEVLLTQGGVSLLRDLEISSLVVDEAHCVCEWGDSFRPAYLRLGEIAESIGPASISALTATATPRILDRIREIVFGDREVAVYRGNPDRPNVSYAVVWALSKEHVAVDLARTSPRPLVLFARSRKTTERYARLLRQRLADPEVRFYHAGLDREERRDVETWFLPSQRGVLCATCAYGMGVDKPDIRSVIHVDLPPSVEAYVQETGRAGRDGEPSRATLVVSAEDGRFGEAIADPVARQRYACMMDYANLGGPCRRAYLQAHLGAAVDHCSGCDVCSGTMAHPHVGRSEILRLIRGQRRRFTVLGAARLLTGDGGYWGARMGLDRYDGYGALGTWRREDAEAALEELVLSGEIRAVRWGPWKDRLTVPRPSAAPRP